MQEKYFRIMGRCSWIVSLTIVFFLPRFRCLEDVLEPSQPFFIHNTQKISDTNTRITAYKESLSTTISLTPEIIDEKGTTTSSSIPHILEPTPKEWTTDKPPQYTESIPSTFSITSTYGKQTITSYSILYQSDSTLGPWTKSTPQYHQKQISSTTIKISGHMNEIRTTTLDFISQRVVDTTPSQVITDKVPQYKESILPTISRTSEITDEKQTITNFIPHKITTPKLQTMDKQSQHTESILNRISATSESIYEEQMMTLNSNNQILETSSLEHPTYRLKQSRPDTMYNITAQFWFVNTHNVSLQPFTTTSSSISLLTSSFLEENMSRKDQEFKLTSSSRSDSNISSVFEKISKNTPSASSNLLLLVSKNDASFPSLLPSMTQKSPSLSTEKIHDESQTLKLTSSSDSDLDFLHQTLISTKISPSSSLYYLISPSKTQLRETEFSHEVTASSSSISMPDSFYNFRNQTHYESLETKPDSQTLINENLTTHEDVKVILASSNTPQTLILMNTPKASYTHVIEPSFDMTSEFLSDVTPSAETKAPYLGMMKKAKVVEITELDNSVLSTVSSEDVKSRDTVSVTPSSELYFLTRNTSVFTLPRTNFTENTESITISPPKNKSPDINQSDNSAPQENISKSKLFKTVLSYYTSADDLGYENRSQSSLSYTTPYSINIPAFSSHETSTEYRPHSSSQPIKDNFILTITPSYDEPKLDRQKFSGRKGIKETNEEYSQNTIMSTKMISSFAYTHATHRFSGSEATYIYMQDFNPLSSRSFIDSVLASSTAKTDIVYETTNEENFTLSLHSHTTNAVENYITESTNQQFNDSKSTASNNEQESILVASTEPMFEIFHFPSDHISSQEIAPKLKQASVKSQHETLFSSSFLSRQSTSQPDLQSSFTSALHGLRFWTTITEPLLTPSDKISGALFTSPYTREEAVVAVSKQTEAQMRSLFSYALSSVINHTHMVSSTLSEMHTAWFENNVSLNSFNTSQHETWNNENENQSQIEYFTFHSNQNASISELATSTQFSFGDARTYLIHPTLSTGYSSQPLQSPILSRMSVNNVVVQMERSDGFYIKNHTNSTPTPSPDQNDMNSTLVESRAIVIPSDTKTSVTVESDNERKNVVQTSESSGILYSTVENYENPFLSSMSDIYLDIMSGPAALSSLRANVDIIDSSLSSTKNVQITKKLDPSYISPVLNNVQSTILDHWNIFQTPEIHITKETVLKQNPPDSSSSYVSKGELEIRASIQSSITGQETNTPYPAILSNVFVTSSGTRYSTEKLKNVAETISTQIVEKIINVEPSTTLKSSVVDSESNLHTSSEYFNPSFENNHTSDSENNFHISSEYFLSSFSKLKNLTEAISISMAEKIMNSEASTILKSSLVDSESNLHTSSEYFIPSFKNNLDTSSEYLIPSFSKLKNLTEAISIPMAETIIHSEPSTTFKSSAVDSKSNLHTSSEYFIPSSSKLKNLTETISTPTVEKIMNIEPSSTLKNSVVDSDMNLLTSSEHFIPNFSILSLINPGLSTSVEEQFITSTVTTRQVIHDSKKIHTSTIHVDGDTLGKHSFVRSQITSESESHINTSIVDSSQSFTKIFVSSYDTSYQNSISLNKFDPYSFQHTSEFPSLIDASDVNDAQFWTTSSKYDPANFQTILSSQLSLLKFETSFIPDYVYSSLTLSSTRHLDLEMTFTSLDKFSLKTEKMSTTALPVSNIIEQGSSASSWYIYHSTPSNAQVQQEKGISFVDILPMSVSAILSGSSKDFDTTRSTFIAETHSPTVKINSISTSVQTETETRDTDRNSSKQVLYPSNSLEIKPSSPVFDTPSSSVVFLFPETNLLVIEINVKTGIDISNDDFKSRLEQDLTTIYVEGLHGRRKRNSFIVSNRRGQARGITVKIKEINRKFGERVEIIFLVMYNGMVVHASLAELTFQKMSDVEMSAILGYPVVVPVSRLKSRSNSPSTPDGWGELFKPLLIVLITLPASIVLIATIIAIIKQCRSKSIHKHPSIPSQMDSLYKHNLVVDVENGDVRNRRISYEYPSDDEYSMASSDVFNEIKSKYSHSMHSKIKNFEKHNVKNHFHNQVERKASDALTNKVKFSLSTEDSKSTCVKTDSNESNDSGVSSDGQKSPGEGPDATMSDSKSHLTNANVPQSVKQQNNMLLPPRNIPLQNPYPVKMKTNLKNLNSERVTSWVFMGDNQDAANKCVHNGISESCKTSDNILQSDTVAQISHDFNHIPSMCDSECQTSDQASNTGVQDHIYETLNRKDSVKEEKAEQTSMTQTESGTSGSDGFEYLEPLRQLLMAVEQQRRRNPPVNQFLHDESVLQRCIHGFCNIGHCHANCSPVSIPSRAGDMHVKDKGECNGRSNCEVASHEKLSVKQVQETRTSTELVCNERQLVMEHQSRELSRQPVVQSNTKQSCIYDQPEMSLVGFASSAEI